MLSPEKLKLIRLLKKMTQQQVATKMGVSKNYITMMENRARPVTDEMYVKWLNALNGVEEEIKEITETEELIKNK